MKSPAMRRYRNSAVRVASIGLATVMLTTLVYTAGTGPAVAEDSGAPDLPESEVAIEGVDGLPVAPRPADHTPGALTGSPDAAFPDAETRHVEVSETVGAAEADGADDEMQPVGSMPISVRADQDATVEVELMPADAGGTAFTLTPETTGPAARAASTTAEEPTDEAHSVEVDVRIDYSEFAEAFGGGYGHRLALRPVLDCDDAQTGDCAEPDSYESVNDTEEQTLTVRGLSLPSGQATMFVAQAEADGEKGTFGASDLSPSSTWDIALHTGDFTWSYDLPLPQVPGELTPTLGIGYSAASIDGRTSATNNQGSWVGDGFSMWPGYIERSYKACGYKDVEDSDGNTVGDLCWDHDNAFISFNGMAGELVPAGNNTWKLQSDDGTRIERLTGSARANGDNDNEYWRVTDTEGTQYYFGYHRLPGWSSGRAVTNSTWTVPVYATKAGEPCYKAAIKDSWCQQAWRWNLDYVVDAGGNVVTYYYDREQNSYGRFLNEENNTRYTRGGTLNRIEYGLTTGNEYSGQPLAKVLFDNDDRCLPGGGADCADITKNPQYWYDTPWDLNCDASADCDRGRYGPSFWTTKRLTGITAQVRSGSSYRSVDSWKLAHHWGTADVDYQLLLSSIQRTGHSATPAITLPKTTFGYTQLANRLDRTGDGYAPFIKARLSSIADEFGGQVDVGYSAPACTHSSTPTPHTNTTRCFPQYLGGGPDHDPDLQWFNKYVTESVTTTDRTGGSPDQVTRYQYLGDAAWRYDENGLVPDEEKTWSQWRGYGHVRVQSGSHTRMESQEDSYFLRGMHGDRRTPSGGTRTVNVELSAGEGDPLVDHPSAAGFPYRTATYDKPGGRVLEKAVTRPWRHQTARSVRDWGTITAEFTGASHTKHWTAVDGSGDGATWRTTEQYLSYDTVAGRLTQIDDRGDTALDTDDRCTRTTYATNSAANLLTLVSRQEVVGTRCATTPDRAKDVISDTHYAYDGAGYGQAPTRGVTTAVADLVEHDGTTARYRESGATHDAYGRILTLTDITADLTSVDGGALSRRPRDDGRTTTSVYTPASGIPSTIRTDSPPAKSGDQTTSQRETTTLDPLRGLPTRVVDANNLPTTVRYDALGRTDRVWYADRQTSLSPSLQFSYRVVEGQPVAVGTTRLGNNNGNLRDTGYTIYDGLLRPRQTQEPGPDGGRLLTDTFHDERGLVSRTFGTYYTPGAPSGTLFLPDDADSVETQTRHTYDGVGRDIRTQVLGGNSDGAKVLATTETTHFGDRVTVVPPDGATVTTSLSDARGRLTELRQHHGRSAASEYDATRYTYTPADQVAGVTTPSGATWEYRYDQQGQRTASVDPDTGTTTSTYSDRGELVTTTNARGITLHRSYDGLGRQTELREENAEGRLRAQWEYDTVQRGKGQLSRATRWEDGEAYVNEVVAYDPRYRPVRSRTIIPGAEGALAGTYETRQDHTPAGLVRGVSYPAAGGLPAHGVSYTYENGTLRPIRAFEQGGLTATTAYSHTGKPLQFAMHRDAADTVWATNTYEWGTQRLQTTRVDRRDQPGVDRRETYSYDDAGNVLSIADTSRTGADVQCFSYDHLRRLTEAWAQSRTDCTTDGGAPNIGGPSPYHHAYTYDEAGNRTTETLHEQDITRTYSYDEDQPHTLTEVVQEAPGVRSLEEYGYDEAGNTVSRQVGGKTQTLEWNPEGRVASVEDADGTTVEYVYDADGSRLIGRTGTETTLYLGHTEVTVANGGSTPTAERYLPMGGGHTAVIDSDGTTSFVMADHHGTGNLAIDAESLETTQRRTLPFGAYRDDVPEELWPGTRTFVGGTDDVSTGLYNIGAREYDAAIGRFISADPIMDLTDPQQVHGYAYANNNPLAYSDPTGLFLNGVINWIHRIVQTIIKKVIKHVSSAIRTAKRKVSPPRRPVISRFSSSRSQASNRSSSTAQSSQRPATATATATATASQASFGGVPTVPGTCGPNTGGVCTDWLQQTSKLMEVFLPAWRLVEEFTGISDARACWNAPSISWECAGTAANLIPGVSAAKFGLKVGGRGVTWLRNAFRGNPCSSFVAGTHVLMADGTTKAIEDVAVGDEVLATDAETGETGARTVTAELTSHGDKLLVTVSVLDGNGNPQQLIATDNHPLWLPATQQWIDAVDLEPGTQLYANDGTLVDVTAVTTSTTATTVHNLTIEGVHTYYVLAGETPVLVHNANCPWTSVRKYDGDGHPVDGTRIPTNDALDSAEKWLGPGYKETVPGSGRYVSRDGTRVARMGESDITGQHGGGPHMNFEQLAPNPKKPGKMMVVENRHIYLE